MRTLWKTVLHTTPSHLASTKGWPKLRLSSAFELLLRFRNSKARMLGFIPEHSGIGEIGGYRSDPQPRLSFRGNMRSWGEAMSSFLCVLHNAVTANAFVEKHGRRTTRSPFLLGKAGCEADSAWLSRKGDKSERINYLVDSASSHMLVSKIKPCMSKYTQIIL